MGGYILKEDPELAKGSVLHKEKRQGAIVSVCRTAGKHARRTNSLTSSTNELGSEGRTKNTQADREGGSKVKSSCLRVF